MLTRLVRKVLRRWTDLDLLDYASLLHLRKEYQVTEIKVDCHSWPAHKTLQKLRLPEEGIAVLAIEHEGIKVI